MIPHAQHHMFLVGSYRYCIWMQNKCIDENLVGYVTYILVELSRTPLAQKINFSGI